jgi:hypothetical protein
MKETTKKYVKYVFAGIGVVYLVLFVGYLVYAGVKRSQPRGPSELEANPERQEEIMAERRAQDLKEQLGLSDEQMKKIAEIFAQRGQDGPPMGPPGPGAWRGMRDEVAKVLTPEQQAQLEQMRGPGGRGGPGGPGGPGGFGGFGALTDPDRIESLEKSMSPEQKARFEKKFQEWTERRQRWGRRGPGGRGQGGPGQPQR